MTGRTLVDLVRAVEKPPRFGRKSRIEVHPFFTKWAKAHKKDLRAAFVALADDMEVDLEQLWTACGFTLHDEVVVWWCDRQEPDGSNRGFEGSDVPPWMDEERTIALLTQARDWEPRQAAEPEPKLSWAERRQRERDLLRMERAAISEIVLDSLEEAAAWGRRIR